MLDTIKCKIEKYFILEKEITLIKKKIQIVQILNNIIHINYDTNVCWKNNYEYYLDNQSYPNIKLSNNFFNKIIDINNICKQKSDFEFTLRKKIIEINNIKNHIIDYIIEYSNFYDIDKFKSKLWQPIPKNSLNKPELEIRKILFSIQQHKKEILLIYPQYRLPVKFKSYLFADFYLLLYIQKKIYPLIIEYDGPKHNDKKFIYFNVNSTKCDIIKNNFSLLNSISIIRINNTNITNEINKCIQYIEQYNLPYINIPPYQLYYQLLN